MVTKWTRSGLVLCLLAAAPTVVAANGENTRVETYGDDVLVTRAVVDQETNRITLNGENFYSRLRRRPAVYLGHTLLVSLSSTDSHVVAQLPEGLAPGTYLVSVANGVDHDSIDVAIGVAGPQGPAGPAGPQGPQGLQGFTGAQGPAGAVGPQGPAGPAGADGATGPAGPVGAVGPQGPAGPTGADGAAGPQGPAGPTGPVGPAGADGAVGPQGAQGPAGADGATGPQGPQGPQGPAGADGANGADGAPGEPGPQGPIGPEGPAGPAGPSGFVAVLNFENALSLTLTTSVATPAACQTGFYVAGQNETALVSIDVTTLTQSNDSIFLAPMYSQNGLNKYGVNFLTAGALRAYEYGTLHNQAVIPLVAGATYRFITGVRSGLGNVQTSEFTCRGVATIVRR